MDIKTLIAGKDYNELKSRLGARAGADLIRLWPDLLPMEKLICFKVLDLPRAFELYEALPFEERYFLFCGFPLQTIAPALEGASAEQGRSFVYQPREFQERMLNGLSV